MKAYHKTFGEIEILSKDQVSTTIVVLSSGEEKKLLNKFANALISESPFVKAKKAKSVAQAPVYTEQDNINFAIYKDREWKKTVREALMTPQQRLENARYRQAGSSLR